MKKNMGGTDGTIRYIVAVLLGVLYFTGVLTGAIATVLLVIAAVLLITSMVSFCPLYALFRLNTCPNKKDGSFGKGDTTTK
jgi:hypothetical protein